MGLLNWFTGQWKRFCASQFPDETKGLKVIPDYTVHYHVSCLTAVVLLLVYALTRWHSNISPLLGAYFFLSIVASVFGIAVGLHTNTRPIRPGLTLLCLAANGFLLTLGRLAGMHKTLVSLVPEISIAGVASSPRPVARLIALLFTVTVMLLTIGVFIPLGRRLGALCIALNRPDAKPFAYGILGGIAAVGVAAFFQFPGVLLVSAFVLTALLQGEKRTPGILASASLAFALCFVPRGWHLERAKPEPQKSAVALSRPSYVERDLGSGSRYLLPFKYAKSLDRILIVGAGGGDLAASALGAGAVKIDALESDPASIQIGTDLHPARPYSNPRVKLHSTPYRSYLAKTQEKYDLIYWNVAEVGFQSSAPFRVALANFDLTQEAFEIAFSKLSADGVIAIGLDSSASEMIGNTQRALEKGSGLAPFVHRSAPGARTFLVVGPNMVGLSRHFGVLPVSREVGRTPTDDMPFVFFGGDQYPVGLSLLAAFMILFLLMLGFYWNIFSGSLPRKLVNHYWGAVLHGATVLLLVQVARIYGGDWLYYLGGLVVAVLLVWVGMELGKRTREGDFAGGWLAFSGLDSWGGSVKFFLGLLALTLGGRMVGLYSRPIGEWPQVAAELLIGGCLGSLAGLAILPLGLSVYSWWVLALAALALATQLSHAVFFQGAEADSH